MFSPENVCLNRILPTQEVGMENCFVLDSPLGDFDLTPDVETKVVYVERHRKASTHMKPTEIPSWCFDPETIWFYFEAPESEDKVSAGERLKNQLQMAAART